MQSAIALSHVSQFAPTDLGGCVLWLRASGGSVVDGGALVQATDLSGHGNHYTQSIPATRPAYMTDLAFPSWAFNGSTTYLTNATTWHAASDYTIAAVVATTAGGLDIMDNNQPQRLIITDSGKYYSGGLQGNARVGSSPAVLVWSLQSPNAGWVYANGATIAGVQPYTQSPLGQGTIGAVYTGSGGNLNGRLMEYIVYDRVLSVTQRTTLTACLGARYGIAVT